MATTSTHLDQINDVELPNRDKHRLLNPLLLQSTMIQFYDQVQATCATNFE